MKIIELLNKEIINIEYYGARKPKYHKEDQNYFFEHDSLVALSTFDHLGSLKDFFQIIKDKLIEDLQDIHIKDYTNQDNFAGYMYLDESVKLNYQESLNEQVTTISLIEKDSLTFNYIILKVINVDNEELLIWIKLKSPLKVENNVFYHNPDNYEIKITKDGLKVDNYPNLYLDINLVSFILCEDDFYVLDKDLYQKYFNLESYYLRQASDVVYSNDNIISDGELLTKGNAKLIYEYFDSIETMFTKLANNEIAKESVTQMISTLNLNLEYNLETNKFILKSAKDLTDLLLLSTGCLGINSLTNEQFKVKKPQYLVED